jgi:hypothetical protein
MTPRRGWLAQTSNLSGTAAPRAFVPGAGESIDCQAVLGCCLAVRGCPT